MHKSKDTYKTIEIASKGILFKEKKSKFFGYAFPISNENEVKPIIETIQKKHHTAGHICYAWQLGIERTSYRANDDGEPNNSAGMPIYGQLQSFELTNVLVVVARIFGGTKLGVGGLITAYRTAAKMTIETSKISEKIQKAEFELQFEYPLMTKVMRTIKQNQLEIISQKMEISCSLKLSVRKNGEETIQKMFNELQGVSLRKLKS